VVPPTRSSRTDVHDDILGSYRTLPLHEDKSPIVWGGKRRGKKHSKLWMRGIRERAESFAHDPLAASD
jgi:hypothetical protein